ncbi:MAG: 50S ribosomal protein L16 [Candidatus Bathyarchaeia archaeon]
MLTKRSGGMAYTQKKYIHGAPPPRISRFTLGDTSAEFEYAVSLVAQEAANITGRALEAARVAANQVLSRRIGGRQYRLKIRLYPHEVVREHRFMGFAGADRLSQGMRGAFGKPRGRSARVKRGQAVITVSVNEDKIDVAMVALKRASAKLPTRCRIVTEKSKLIDR